MDDDPRLASAKQFYARLAAAGGGALADRLEAAFVAVPRERFLGPGPWGAVSLASGKVIATPDDDPIHVYQNLLFTLDRDKSINNGEPCLHGQMLGALAPKQGDRVLHIGCGTGYYTAILADLVGRDGRVEGYEIEPALVERARAALQPWPQASVHRVEIGAEPAPLSTADAIYVNAGATRPLAAWLDALDDGGRLVFPLTGSQRSRAGVILAVTRRGVTYEARAVGYAIFIPCQGATDAEEARRFDAAYTSGAIWRTRSLVRDDVPAHDAVLVGKGWWLSAA